jgi:hypothetical protein
MKNQVLRLISLLEDLYLAEEATFLYKQNWPTFQQKDKFKI